MKFLRTTKLQPGSIKKHHGWNDDLVEKVVEDMVATIKAGKGATIAPIGLDQEQVMWWGHHRLEAHRRAGVKTIRCDVFRFENRNEAREAALRENLDRKEMTPRQRADGERELVAIMEARITKARGAIVQPQVAEVPETRGANLKPQVASKRGPAMSAHGEAVRERAKEKGVTRQAIEKVIATRTWSPADGVGGSDTGGGSAELPTEDAATLPPPPPPIETFGLPISDELLATVVTAQAHIKKVAQLLQQSQAGLTALENVFGYGEAKAKELNRLVHQVAHLVRQAMPAALCHYCKGEPEITCDSCNGRRFLMQEAMVGRPADLLLGWPNAQVLVNKRYMLLTEWQAHPDRGHGNGTPNGRDA